MPRSNDSEVPSILRRAAVSAGLSVLFLVVYGGCNWLVSRRPDLGSCYFGWERSIPFVPLFIVPYLSIDLFFVTAPFLCRTRIELGTFCRRIALAILVAGCCFLLWPLRFAFARPSSPGWSGALFDWFRQLDAPTNLVPSLHAALLMLLWPVFFRHLRGLSRIFIMSWFVLIALSPVLTYQHHVIDIASGFALAVACTYFVREAIARTETTGNPRAGLYYITGAVSAMVGAWIFWPWGVVLLWAAMALALVSSAYFGMGAVIFRKENGVIPWSARLVLAPCLLGQYLSLFYYRRQCRAWDEVTPGVWIGRCLGDAEAARAVANGVTAVLDLTAEFTEAKPFRDASIRYRNIPVVDLTAPTVMQLREMAEFITRESKSGTVYVHCKIGYSRSAAAVAAALLLMREADDVADAIAQVRRARPSIVIRPEIERALREAYPETGLVSRRAVPIPG